MRQSLYLRETLDADILLVVEPLMQTASFAHVIRELVRDGIKYRELQKSGKMYDNRTQSNTPSKPYKPKASGVKYEKVPQSNTKPLMNIKLEKKEVSNKEIESKLDNF
ncbi:hypothetical protein MARVELLAND_138 [Bacillus phage vB_BspM_MarvelLand]|nr:hypothetical protein MARVELLAND_138 [Bacillus phage vB_BspM_MarvelLand]